MSIVVGKSSQLVIISAATLAAVAISGNYNSKYLFPDEFKRKTVFSKMKNKEINTINAKELKDSLSQISKDIKLSKQKTDSTELYLTDYLGIVNAGSLNSLIFNNKFVLGLPISLMAKNKEEIPAIYKKHLADVDWSSREGKKLLDSSFLSENGRKFAIAQSIYKGCSREHLYSFYICATVVAANILIGRKFGMSLRFFKEHIPMKFGMYFVLSALTFNIVQLALDSVSLSIDSKADRQAADISVAYAEGAIEYYQKMVQRNKAMRRFPETMMLVTAEGNEDLVNFQRNKATTRLKKLKQYLKEKNK